MSQDIPTIQAVHAEFEREWEKLYRLYGHMLSVKTLRVVKGLARNVYMQGRIDGMMTLSEQMLARQLGRKKEE
jgi:hypothetical protein